MQKRKTEEEKRADALYSFIRCECAKTGFKNITGLAAALGVNYSTLYYRLTTGAISALMMNRIIRTLNMDSEAVARLHKI
jgi:hypothetical protein